MASQIDKLAKRIEQIKQQLATTELYLATPSATPTRWSIPDRRIAMRYLIDCDKNGMDPKHWARLHPEDWKRLVQVAPLKKGPISSPESLGNTHPPTRRK